MAQCQDIREESGSLEGEVLKVSDGIAYINHDLDDAIRANLITIDDLPADAMAVLGDRHAKRIDTLVRSIISYSNAQDAPGRIAMPRTCWTRPARCAASLFRTRLSSAQYHRRYHARNASCSNSAITIQDIRRSYPPSINRAFAAIRFRALSPIMWRA
ncbi:MAG: hypothetical protein R2845_06375 [Thermomicrobiales bacterium]